MQTETTTTAIRNLTPGTRFTATACNGRELTLTVGEDVGRFPAVDRFDPRTGKSDPEGERAFVSGTTGSATFFADDLATIH